MAIAWVFPGQGSQKVGMAEALLSIEGSRERFAMASELLGRDLLAICQGESGDRCHLNLDVRLLSCRSSDHHSSLLL